ncbi:hypothetical protein ABGB18_06485 [Nonomuraea sp. B12E4]|uniref:hypothetical protein n=1 Tax=Nonomuraea sp. B12E4 TaxID=3153564 RepID=UPI00325CA39D
MDTVLERWRARYLPGDFPFDFTIESVSALEPLVLERFDDPRSVRADDEFVQGAVRYLGEATLRAWPSRWAFLGWRPYDDLPVIRSNTPDAFEEIAAPLHVLKLFVSEPEPGGLGYNTGVIEDAVDRYQKALRAGTR